MLQLLNETKCFGGVVRKYVHQSKCTQTPMNVSVYLPPKAFVEPVPCIYWLSGLTCTEENFITKAGAQRAASLAGVALVCPDTSPRGLNLPGEHDSYDFGAGAGFYVDATTSPWDAHYRMYSYVTKELPETLQQLPIRPDHCSIMGHSMGGHGALVAFLRKPHMFRSVSAFAPICHPSACGWGKKAFGGYLGEDESLWKEYDATELVKIVDGGDIPPILIDQGSADGFLLEGQLRPDEFCLAAEKAGVDVTYRLQEGYDHSYYFIATFIEDHIQFHSKHLHAQQ